MSQYVLNINFNESDIEAISTAYNRLALVKKSADSAEASVAWVNFKPWQNNAIDWEQQFAVYSPNSAQQKPAIKSFQLYSKSRPVESMVEVHLETESGEQLAGGILVPKNVLDSGMNFSLTFDEEKKECYLIIE